MVAITLNRTYINLVSTGALITAYTGRGRTRSYKTDGSVQPFAGGRFRSISTEGVSGAQTFVLRDVNDADLETLKSWMGETVLVRDHRGRRMFGTYYDIAYADRMSQGYYDVTIVLSEVTYQEG